MKRFLLIIIILLLTACTDRFQPKQDLAIFVWDLELLNDDVLESLKEEGFTLLYLYYSPDTEEDLFKESLDLCDSADLSVYALNGSYEWIDHPDDLDDFMNHIEAYASDDYPCLKGVILDIEPYVMKKRDEDEDYAVFQELISNAKKRASTLDLRLNAVIPFWYESVCLPSMTEDENLAKWVIEQSHETTVMAYRNELDGNNGIINLTDEEVNYSAASGNRLVLALETRPSKEGDHISFAGQNRQKVIETIKTINEQFSSDYFAISYAVHDLASWLELE